MIRKEIPNIKKLKEKERKNNRDEKMNKSLLHRKKRNDSKAEKKLKKKLKLASIR